MKRNRVARLFPWAVTFWLGTFALLAGLYLAGIPAAYAQFVAQPPYQGEVEPAVTLALMAELRLSPERAALFEIAQRLITNVGFAVVGLLLFRRKVWPARRAPDPPWGLWLISFLLIWVATNGGNIGDLANVPYAHPQVAALVRFLGWPATVAWPLLLYTFPDGRFTPGWTRWFTLAFVPLALLTTYSPGVLDNLVLPLVPFLLSFLAAPVLRYRRADTRQRLQLKWALFGLAAVPAAWLLSGLVLSFAPASGTAAGLRVELLFKLLTLPLYLLAPIGLGVAVLRSQLWEIDVIIRKTLVYGMLTAALALVYSGSIIVMQGLFGRVAGSRSPLVIVFSTLLIAALFSPMRRRIQESIDRRFYRRKYDARLALEKFARITRDEVEMEVLTGAIVQTVGETVQPERMAVWLKEPG